MNEFSEDKLPSSIVVPFFKDFIYLLEREREHKRAQRARGKDRTEGWWVAGETGREKQALR